MKRLAQATGVLENTVMLNFRTDVEVLKRILPFPFDPRLVDGFGLVSILLFRMKDLYCETNIGWPSLPSDHVLYRISVSFNHGGRRQSGMYILRHEVNTRLPLRQRRRGLFPLAGSPVRWNKNPWKDQFEWTLKSGSRTKLQVKARPGRSFSGGSLFQNLEEAADFFSHERFVLAPRYQQSIFSSTHFLPLSWEVKPLQVLRLKTDFKQLANLFPSDRIFYDSGLMWPQMPCKWQKSGDIIVPRPFGQLILNRKTSQPVSGE